MQSLEAKSSRQRARDKELETGVLRDRDLRDRDFKIGFSRRVSRLHHW